jgi:hypothetical protein
LDVWTWTWMDMDMAARPPMSQSGTPSRRPCHLSLDYGTGGHGPPCRCCSCSCSCMLYLQYTLCMLCGSTLSDLPSPHHAGLMLPTLGSPTPCAPIMRRLSSGGAARATSRALFACSRCPRAPWRRSPRAMSTNGARGWPSPIACPELVRALILESHSVQFGVRRR